MKIADRNESNTNRSTKKPLVTVKLVQEIKLQTSKKDMQVYGCCTCQKASIFVTWPPLTTLKSISRATTNQRAYSTSCTHFKLSFAMLKTRCKMVKLKSHP